MSGRPISYAAVLLAVLTVTVVVSAQERSAPAGAVVVRPVQVREVRVNPPLPERREIPPDFISRPPGSSNRAVPRSSSIAPSRHNVRGDHRRNQSFAFRPRFNIGYGVVVGYPIIYPYAYPYDPFSPSMTGNAYAYAAPPPSPNTYSNVDAQYANGNVSASSPLPAAVACQGSAPCGGLSFDVAPGNAQVWVDGVFSGVADDFDATSTPLLLAPGDHYIELRLAGYRTASFDTTTAPGEVTPYQGTLEQLRLRTP